LETHGCNAGLFPYEHLFESGGMERPPRGGSAIGSRTTHETDQIALIAQWNPMLNLWIKSFRSIAAD
jgi:hypothetical protein